MHILVKSTPRRNCEDSGYLLGGLSHQGRGPPAADQRKRRTARETEKRGCPEGSALLRESRGMKEESSSEEGKDAGSGAVRWRRTIKKREKRRSRRRQPSAILVVARILGCDVSSGSTNFESRLGLCAAHFAVFARKLVFSSYLLTSD